MGRRATDPALKVIEYFQTADPKIAQLTLQICTMTLAKRIAADVLPPKRARAQKVNDDAAVTNHEGIAVKP